MTIETDSRVRTRQEAQITVAGKLGSFETRLAGNSEEVRAAQKVRYQVFKQNGAKDPQRPIDPAGNIDQDWFDENFDHLLVIDPLNPENHGVVGTQRFQVKTPVDSIDDYYSFHQFDLKPMLQQHAGKRFMELGRSCILAEYRNKRMMELLWHGTWDYAVKNEVDVMFGCASFPTTSPNSIREELSFLQKISPASGAWAVEPNSPHSWPIPQTAKTTDVSRGTIRRLPPLIKGYLRLGAMFSSHAVVDHDFGTTDILVILPVSQINPRYVNYYGANADRHAVQ